MRFIMLIKGDRSSEAGELPPPAVFDAMGKYNADLATAGALLAADGLQPTATGFAIRNTGGTLTVTDGPFTEAKEVIAGFWMIKAASLQDAIDWARRCPFEACAPAGAASAQGQIEIRPLYELDDFPKEEHESGWREQEAGLREELDRGVPPAPDKLIRYLLMFKADARSEAGVLPDEKELTEMGGLMAEMGAAGVLLSGEGLQPSAKGARVFGGNGKRTVMDGPFAEAKELIAGFCMVRVASPAEALDWARRMSALNPNSVLEGRRLSEASDFAR